MWVEKFKPRVVMDKYSLQNCRIGRIYGDSVDLLLNLNQLGQIMLTLQACPHLISKSGHRFGSFFWKKNDKIPKVKIENNSMQLIYTYLKNFYELYLPNIWRHVWSLNSGTEWLRPYFLNPLIFLKYGLKLKNKKNTFFSNFTKKMALLFLEQLLRGVFVIATPPTMDWGTSEEIGINTPVAWCYL